MSNSKKLTAVILAAGEGKRMKSNIPKVLHKLCGKTMLDWVAESVRHISSPVVRPVVVVGHMADAVTAALPHDSSYVIQDRLLGTGDAVKRAADYISDYDCTLVIGGDTPLVQADSLKAAYSFHREHKNDITVITASVDNPFGYGRILRNEGDLLKIVEEREASPEIRKITEVNSGIYFFNTQTLLESLGEINDKNNQSEYYLTDTVEICLSKGKKIGAFMLGDSSQIAGVNDRLQLCEASFVMRRRINLRLMAEGLTLIDPENTYIDADVRFGLDCTVYPGTVIEGVCRFGDNCIIGGSKITDSSFGSGTQVLNSVVIKSKVGDNCEVGPFAYLRPNSKIGCNVKIGDFVEIKNSSVGDFTKISHLSYVGDADIGSKVNMGCGSIVVNYDGTSKHRSIVEDEVFVGCNVNLISPVKVNRKSFIAAGSTITDDVPSHSLAIARSRQVNKLDWKAGNKSGNLFKKS